MNIMTISHTLVVTYTVSWSYGQKQAEPWNTTTKYYGATMYKEIN